MFQVLMMMNNDGRAIKGYSLESRSALTYTAAASKSHSDILKKPHSSTVDYVNGEEIGEPVENVISKQQRSAKIHDFCFGIPFGELLCLLVLGTFGDFLMPFMT